MIHNIMHDWIATASTGNVAYARITLKQDDIRFEWKAAETEGHVLIPYEVCHRLALNLESLHRSQWSDIAAEGEDVKGEVSIRYNSEDDLTRFFNFKLEYKYTSVHVCLYVDDDNSERNLCLQLADQLKHVLDQYTD